MKNQTTELQKAVATDNPAIIQAELKKTIAPLINEARLDDFIDATIAAIVDSGMVLPQNGTVIDALKLASKLAA